MIINCIKLRLCVGGLFLLFSIGTAICCFDVTNSQSTAAFPSPSPSNSGGLVKDTPRPLEYRNEKDSEDDVLGLPIKLKFDGNYARAISIGYDAFEMDDMIPKEKRNVVNYEIQLRESKSKYYVLFRAKLAPNEKPSLGGATSIGKDTMYVIDRETFRLLGRTFFK